MVNINGAAIDTTNQFFVGVQGNDVVIMKPPHRMSKPEALVFAAWIATLADDDGISFDAALTAVHNT